MDILECPMFGVVFIQEPLVEYYGWFGLLGPERLSNRQCHIETVK